MSRITRYPLIVGLLSAALAARADSAPVVAEPVEETPAPASAPASVKPSKPAEPVAAPAPAAKAETYAQPVKADAEATRIEIVSSKDSSEWGRAAVPAEKKSRQVHSAYYVNRVAFGAPAGVKVWVKKDWYSKEVVVEYAANPYTDWQGVTPNAFVFKHTGTTLEVNHVTPKYLPKVVFIRVPAAVDVIVK